MKLTQLASAVILATAALPTLAAKYQLTVVPVADIANNNYAQAIDDNGNMVVNVQTEFNPPIDLSLFDFTNETLRANLTDPDAAEQGNLNDADYTYLYQVLASARSNNNINLQRLAEYRSYQSDGVDYTLLPGFDEYSADFDDYTQSVQTLARDSVNGDYVVGTSTAAYKKINYTFEESEEDTVFIINDMYRQGFVETNDVITPLPPVDALLNGYSEAFAINNSLQVVGFGTISFTETVELAVEACSDDELRGDVPISVCEYQLLNSTAFTSGNQMRAHIWQLDANGGVVSTNTYDLVFTPEEDDTARYLTRAFGLNNNGIAVGDSSTGERVIVTRPGSSASFESGIVATSFSNGETVEILPRDESLKSGAVDINDENWVTGFRLIESSGFARNRLFIYNLDSGEAIYPEGFFNTAAVTPKAINNNNIVVGFGESDSSVQNNRQVRAFMYDMESEEFTDLNTYLTCEDQEKYTLVSAEDINDNNEIIANARIRSTSRYITGVEALDNEGNTNPTDKIVAVKLTPSASGQVEQCEATEEENYERQGATMSFSALLFAGLALIWRRRKLA